MLQRVSLASIVVVDFFHIMNLRIEAFGICKAKFLQFFKNIFPVVSSEFHANLACWREKRTKNAQL